LGFFKNVGLSADYKISESSSPTVSDSDLCCFIYAAVADVLRKNRILFAVPVHEETPESYFGSLPSIDLSRCISFLKRSQYWDGNSEGEDVELDTILEDQHNMDFKSGHGTLPFWRLIILQNPGMGMEFTASFIYHHAIGDGVSGLIFHNSFRDALEAGVVSSPERKSETIVFTDENTSILPPLEELHPLPVDSNTATNLEGWTGNPIHVPCNSRWSSFCLSPSASEAFFQECKGNNISITSALSSIIATALFRNLPPTVEALTCIIPVNLRPWLKLPREVSNNAIGTYFDATRVQFSKSQVTEPEDVWAGAQQASKSINDYLCNVSLSGEPYTSVAFLKSIPNIAEVFSSMIGKPRDAAFEVTNVGLLSISGALKTQGNTPVWQIGRVLLSRSSAASGTAITISVATGGNGSMALGFSWQEGVLERDLVGNIRETVKKYLQRYE
jgi:Alcohol acetyltransferase